MYSLFPFSILKYGKTGRPNSLQKPSSSSGMLSEPMIIPSEWKEANFARFMPTGSAKSSKSLDSNPGSAAFSARSALNLSFMNSSYSDSTTFVFEKIGSSL